MSVKNANEAVNSIRSKLNQSILNGKAYWFSEEAQERGQASQTSLLDSDKQAFLLSIYDEYTIAYRDRSDISEKRDIERMISMGNALTGVIILDGKVGGTWKRIFKKDTIEIKLNPFKKLDETEMDLVMKGVERYGKFWNKAVILA